MQVQTAPAAKDTVVSLGLIATGLSSKARQHIERHADPIIPNLCWTEKWLRGRVRELLANLSPGEPNEESVDGVCKSTIEAIRNDDLLSILIEAVNNRIIEHVDVAIDLGALTEHPVRSTPQPGKGSS